MSRRTDSCHGPLIQDCTQTLQQAFQSVDHLLLVALVLPVPVVRAAQVDGEEARTDAQLLLGDGN